MKEKLNVNSLIGLMVLDREIGKVRENEREWERERKLICVFGLDFDLYFLF